MEWSRNRNPSFGLANRLHLTPRRPVIASKEGRGLARGNPLATKCMCQDLHAYRWNGAGTENPSFNYPEDLPFNLHFNLPFNLHLNLSFNLSFNSPTFQPLRESLIFRKSAN